MRKIFAFCILFTAAQLIYSQPHPYDSLELQLTSAKADTQKLEILKQLVNVAFGSDLQKALGYMQNKECNSPIRLATRTGNRNFMKWKEECMPTSCI